MKNSNFIQKLAILLALCLLTLIYLIKTGSNYLFLLDAPHNKSISGVVLLYELYSGREFIIFNFCKIGFIKEHIQRRQGNLDYFPLSLPHLDNRGVLGSVDTDL